MPNKTIAEEIYENFLKAIQDAEEMGGPELQEYTDLMDKISAEAAKRSYNAKFQHACLENNPLINEKPPESTYYMNKKMNNYKNTNDAYGMSGPFEAGSKDDLADEMMSTFRVWATERVSSGEIDQEYLEQDIADMRAEFISGLELVP